MHVLVAADSFKDALSADRVCQALANGIRRAKPDAQVTEFPLSDGGEGAFDVLAHHLALQTVVAETFDPLFRPIRASYGLGAGGRTAFVEMAGASGLQLLRPEERNPLHTTTFGTGMLLADAQRRGATRLILAIGGSATTDGGTGMAAALGWQFTDTQGRELPPTGESLGRIARILAPAKALQLQQVEVICDVTNPLFGPDGAAAVYAPQKGANPSAVAELEAGLQHLAQLAEQQLHRPGLAHIPGAGAAGGLGFGAMAFLNATLHRGIDLILDLTHFDEILARADLVVTGEGKLDGQTLHGKLIQGICQRAARRGVPVIAFCGHVEASPEQIQAIGLQQAVGINDIELPLPELLARTGEHLERAAEKMMRSCL
ncbi:MAG: glycerate kinase [Thermoanaerobaculia bacterium]|nr:glycerate kinase [Thermoanaerobaculia bacterium]